MGIQPWTFSTDYPEHRLSFYAGQISNLVNPLRTLFLTRAEQRPHSHQAPLTGLGREKTDERKKERMGAIGWGFVSEY